VPQVGWEYGGRTWTQEEMLAYARTYPPDFPYPPEVVKAMFQGRAQQRSFPSPTMVAGCARRVTLERLTDWTQEPQKAYQSFRGTMAHTLLEHLDHEEDAVLERRVRLSIRLPDGRDMLLAGKPDKVVPSQNLLLDYKTLPEIKRQPKDGWTPQLSSYRYMLVTPHEYLAREWKDLDGTRHEEWLPEDPLDITRGQIAQLTMGDMAKLEIELWPLEATLAWLRGRMQLHAGNFDGTYDLDHLAPVLQYGLDSDAFLCTGRRKDGKEVTRPWCSVYALLSRKGA
jgi:hypothetical protein